MMDAVQRIKGSKWDIPTSKHYKIVFFVVLEDTVYVT
jgi:hypothetical protein